MAEMPTTQDAVFGLSTASFQSLGFHMSHQQSIHESSAIYFSTGHKKGDPKVAFF